MRVILPVTRALLAELLEREGVAGLLRETARLGHGGPLRLEGECELGVRVIGSCEQCGVLAAGCRCRICAARELETAK